LKASIKAQHDGNIGGRMSISYRSEIDGLRALAVLPVVAFHAGIQGLSGGYVGVDVFFVISGFLITRILWREMQDGAFTFRAFYFRRAKRILPALYAVLAATLVAGYLLLTPADLRTLSESALSVLGFVSNFYFWTQSGYFGPTAEQLPLLHTWSVSVEEQFYIVFPVLLLAIHRLAGRYALIVVGTLLALAFVGSAWMTAHHPMASFYLLHTRAWELLLGAALALMPAQHKTSPLIAAPAFLIGIAMIVSAIVVFDADTRTPGLPAALPCAGAALTIWAGTNAGYTRLLLANPLMIGIGRISYSMYLWHWPLLIFMPPELGERGEFSPVVLAGYFAALFMVSALSYVLIEQPFRRGLEIKVPLKPLLWGTAAVALLAASAASALTGGFPSRLGPLHQQLAGYAEYGKTRALDAQNCFVPSSDAGYAAYVAQSEKCLAGSSPSVFLWGDSVAAFQAPGFRRLAEPQSISLKQAAMSSCRPSLSPTTDEACTKFNGLALSLIEREQPTVVLLSARWNMSADYNLEQLPLLASELTARGHRVVILGPPVQYNDPLPTVLIRANAPNLEAFDTTSAIDRSVIEFETKLRSRLEGLPITYVSVLELTCHGLQCQAMSEDEPMTWDNHHLTEAGADFLAKRVLPAVVEAMN
jgi:peptidoglycan/LPS O-acetylase OafA/YrhL